MASRIQGITVEIGGDTTKLSKALEGVNKSIKGTQSGLKDVNKLLKLDPSNTELVVQKQKMLKDAIQATKEKLATLKTAAQQANEQLANGEITQQQYDALQREIAETEQNLKPLQQTSYEGQKSYYTKLIHEKAGWIFAGMYADEAISGTNRNHRTEFNQMMEDAMNGKIDYIITKSISRFARNTVDTLNCVRQLRQCDPPIGVYFEKENIDTLDASGELLLTILSALAQEESNSISKNIGWSIQKKFQEGVPFGNPRSVYGYTDGKNKEWVIEEEQAKVVRFIFEEFLLGKSAYRISQELNEKGIPSPKGTKWITRSVDFILRNEKYVGDCEMQKTVTTDFLRKAQEA